MKIRAVFGLLLLSSLCAIVVPAQTQTTKPGAASPQQTADAAARKQLAVYMTDFRSHPEDSELRDKIIDLAKTLKPAPAVPRAAQVDFATATAQLDHASTAEGFKAAASLFDQVTAQAPWWAAAYLNAAKAYAKAADLESAKRSLALFMEAVRPGVDTTDAESLQRDIEQQQAAKEEQARQEQAAKEEQARREQAAREEQARQQQMQQFQQAVATYRQSPSDDTAGKVIQMAAAMNQMPPISEEARQHFVRGTTLFKDAKTQGDYKQVVDELIQAVHLAPWWPEARYDYALAVEAWGDFDGAIDNMKLYLLFKLSDADARAAQDKIYEIDAKEELQRKHEEEMVAKYGGGRGSGCDFDCLFRYGAVVQNMAFDASGNERAISLRISTKKENGLLHNYLSVYDITSHNDTFGQEFDANWTGTKSFWLDDRGPYRDWMTLTVTPYGDGDANITIAPGNNASASIRTSLASLLKERASQAVYAGTTKTIGSRKFYVLGQATAVGSLLFFPLEIKGLLEKGSVQDLMPMLVANVNYRRGDQNVNFNNPDLGDVDGTHYHLEFSGGYWQPEVGRGEDH